MNYATLIKPLSKGKVLYKLDPPIKVKDYAEDIGGMEVKEHEYVVVSAADAMFTGPETYIFAADSEGKILNWSELEGSYRGGYDHETALKGAGYTLKN